MLNEGMQWKGYTFFYSTLHGIHITITKEEEKEGGSSSQKFV